MAYRAPRHRPAATPQDLSSALSSEKAQTTRALRKGNDRRVVCSELDVGSVTSIEIELFSSAFGDLVEAIVARQEKSE